MDLSISGAATIDCKDQQYTLSGSDVSLPQGADSCIYNAVSSNGLKDLSVTYDSGANTIDVS
eukprot:gene29238-54543_t